LKKKEFTPEQVIAILKEAEAQKHGRRGLKEAR
jgi:hypothetical protein